MVKVTWSLFAKADLDEIEAYIAIDSPYYARRTVEKILKRVEVLHSFPQIGRMVPEFDKENIRELIEGNYRIIYFNISENEIVITRVHHAARLLK
jgi:toxin ParE1/3/4